jgi:hypothetical protein
MMEKVLLPEGKEQLTVVKGICYESREEEERRLPKLQPATDCVVGKPTDQKMEEATEQSAQDQLCNMCMGGC